MGEIKKSARALFPADGGDKWLRLENPRRLIVARRLDGVRAALDEAEREARDGGYVAGFVSFEAARAFDEALAVCPDSFSPANIAPPPLLWFAVFARPRLCSLNAAKREYVAGRFLPLVDDDAYRRAFGGVMRAISRGDAYQINLTFSLAARIVGDAEALFADLARAQASPWAAFIECEEWALCSASPECFFIRQNAALQSRPMKGTRALSNDKKSRRQSMDELARAAKDRAENLMIVDMLRNDMGRLADARDVRARELCAVRAYPTVAQMTSTVECTTRASLADIFKALFPCASVTGAPKVAAMRFIRELEARPRGVYCGAIGRIMPGGAARFCVAIRTLWWDKKTANARYDVGGGIVADSTAAGERKEAFAKARILSALGDGGLIETMHVAGKKGEEGKIALLSRHLRRLQKSANALGFVCALNKIRAAIKNAAAISGDKTLRLVLYADGKFVIQSKPPPRRRASLSPLPVLLFLSKAAVQSGDALLRHKTTKRGVYRRALAAARRRGCTDALLTNERGEITETCIANFAARLSKRRLRERLAQEEKGDLPPKTRRALSAACPPPLTPPISCGLLPGVMRAAMLARGELLIAKIRLADLKGATLYRLNAVRGMEKIQIARGEELGE